MSTLRGNSGSNSNEDIFSKIESSNWVAQVGWDDLAVSYNDVVSIISKANASISLPDYLFCRLKLEHISSSSGWIYRAYCPFHKDGNERTPSFFVNSVYNRFYCQACGITGGIVEYISRMYGRPPCIVGEHILNCALGKVEIESERAKKIREKKLLDASVLNISNMHRKFIRDNINDENALEYATKIMKGMDRVIEKNPNGFEKSINDISIQFENYLLKYRKEKCER